LSHGACLCACRASAAARRLRRRLRPRRRDVGGRAGIAVRCRGRLLLIPRRAGPLLLLVILQLQLLPCLRVVLLAVRLPLALRQSRPHACENVIERAKRVVRAGVVARLSGGRPDSGGSCMLVLRCGILDALSPR
jgi:hypothetical protein